MDDDIDPMHCEIATFRVTGAFRNGSMAHFARVITRAVDGV